MRYKTFQANMVQRSTRQKQTQAPSPGSPPSRLPQRPPPAEPMLTERQRDPLGSYLLRRCGNSRPSRRPRAAASRSPVLAGLADGGVCAKGVTCGVGTIFYGENSASCVLEFSCYNRPPILTLTPGNRKSTFLLKRLCLFFWCVFFFFFKPSTLPPAATHFPDLAAPTFAVGGDGGGWGASR